MEKDAAGYPQGHTNPGTSRTSPAAYPTSRPVLRGRGSSNTSLLPGANSGKSGRASREQALHRMAIRQARLERLALSASGHERMVKGPTAASKEERIDFSAGIAWFGDILNYRVVVRRDWTPFGL